MPLLVTAEQMRALDRETIEVIGVPGVVLMEAAGRGVVEVIAQHYDVPRARDFYQKVFGWSFEPWGPPNFYLIETGEEQGRAVRDVDRARVAVVAPAQAERQPVRGEIGHRAVGVPHQRQRMSGRTVRERARDRIEHLQPFGAMAESMPNAASPARTRSASSA